MRFDDAEHPLASWSDTGSNWLVGSRWVRKGDHNPHDVWREVEVVGVQTLPENRGLAELVVRSAVDFSPAVSTSLASLMEEFEPADAANVQRTLADLQARLGL